MYVYSGYHDEFFEVPGRARKITRSVEHFLPLIGRFVPLEDVQDFYFGAEVEVEGVYAVEIWIGLESGVTNLIFVDSPIPLNLEQWQRLINILSKGYKPYQLA